jgi:uroporphyrinogen-III synthase/uroporphyrinogen III methyltransferase/synthase
VTLPLAGRRVLVTRAAHQAGKLSDALRELGATPVEVPVIEIQPPEDPAPLDKAIQKLDTYDWLILTSANTVRTVAERSASIGVACDQGAFPRVAAVGEATATAAHDAGIPVELVPENYVAESLVESFLRMHEVSGHDFSRADGSENLKGHDFSRAEMAPKEERALAPEGSLSGQRILLARAAIARDVIPDTLRATGAIVDVVDAYRNVMPASAPAHLRSALEQGIAAATFTSSSSVTHLAAAAKAAGLAFPFAGVAAISIGPITTQTLREYNWEPAAEASPSDIPGLVAALARHFNAS